MLTFDPDQRISIDDALRHPYLSEFREPAEEITRMPIDIMEFEFDEHNLTTQQLKGKKPLIQT